MVTQTIPSQLQLESNTLRLTIRSMGFTTNIEATAPSLGLAIDRGGTEAVIALMRLRSRPDCRNVA